jgi:hypothetical protein
MLQCVHVDLIKYFAMDFYLLPVVPVQTDSTYTETHLLKNYFFTVPRGTSTYVHVPVQPCTSGGWVPDSLRLLFPLFILSLTPSRDMTACDDCGDCVPKQIPTY